VDDSAMAGQLKKVFKIDSIECKRRKSVKSMKTQYKNCFVHHHRHVWIKGITFARTRTTRLNTAAV
jgi:hypothetical protein